MLFLDSKEKNKCSVLSTGFERKQSVGIASDSKEKKKQVLCFFRFEGPRKQVLCFFWIRRAKETGVVFLLDSKGLGFVFENLKDLRVLSV